MTEDLLPEDREMAETIQTVGNALPVDLLKKHDYGLTSAAAENHGSTQWTWHRVGKDGEPHRHVSLAVLLKDDGSIDLAEFWAGAYQGRRFTRRCISSRKLDIYHVDAELERCMERTIAAANQLGVDDLEYSRSYDVIDDPDRDPRGG
ncbi:hypothetical protein ACFVXA_05245 [Streptomyces sp. NPDC058246]|uniref:hypothetical protein n=1 Tax=unclassified Streptomyces TaxID=2593676 RepID=UPI00365DEA6D